MRIAIIGQQDFGKAVLEAFLARGDDVAGVFCAREKEGAKADPLKVAAQEKGLKVFQFPSLRDPEAHDALRALGADVGIMAYVLQFAPDSLVRIPRKGTIQYHPSLLPKYRGPEPVARAILNGDPFAGVCIVKVVEKMDAGPMLGITRVAVPPESTTPEMEDLLAQVGADLLVDVITQVGDRKQVEIPQDEREATYAKKFEKNDGRIDWRKPAAKIQNFVRALIPYPCAFTFLGGKQRVVIHKVKGTRYPSKPDHRPGSILSVDKDSFKVACADGDMTILELQPENKRRMSAAEFVNGYQPKPGQFFT